MRLILIVVLLFMFGCGGGEAKRLENVHRAAVSVKIATELGVNQLDLEQYGMLVRKFATEVAVAKESGPIPKQYEMALEKYAALYELWGLSNQTARTFGRDLPMFQNDDTTREIWAATGKLLDSVKSGKR